MSVLLSLSLFRLGLWASGLILVFGFFQLIHVLKKKHLMTKAMESFPRPPTHWLYGHALEVNGGHEEGGVEKGNSLFFFQRIQPIRLGAMEGDPTW